MCSIWNKAQTQRLWTHGHLLNPPLTRRVPVPPSPSSSLLLAPCDERGHYKCEPSRGAHLFRLPAHCWGIRGADGVFWFGCLAESERAERDCQSAVMMIKGAGWFASFLPSSILQTSSLSTFPAPIFKKGAARKTFAASWTDHVM